MILNAHNHKRSSTAEEYFVTAAHKAGDLFLFVISQKAPERLFHVFDNTASRFARFLNKLTFLSKL